MRRRFTWPGMKKCISDYRSICQQCQLNKAKYKQKTESIIFSPLSTVPFETVHVDFAELKKKSEGVKKMQSFLVCSNECSRMQAAKPGKENADAVISLLSKDMFKGWKCVVSDNGPAFKSQTFSKWAKHRNITRTFTAPWHPSVNGLAERIQYIKQYMSMYPGFPAGSKCCLQAADLI